MTVGFSPDWNALFAAAAGLAASAAGWGALRQKVNAMMRAQDKLENRVCTVEEAVIKATDIKNDVNRLRDQMEGAHKLAAAEAKGSSELINEKVEGLGREVRTFLQGMSAAGAKLPAAVRSRAS